VQYVIARVEICLNKYAGIIGVKFSGIMAPKKDPKKGDAESTECDFSVAVLNTNNQFG
jgi:hypothetical protein